VSATDSHAVPVVAKTIYQPAYQQLIIALRQRRIDLGLSQSEVAQALGYAQTTFSAIERGGRRLDVMEFIALARHLGLTPIGALRHAEQLAARLSLPARS
jgi:transcriptional regulator with XRE-family HTH domain